MKVKFSLIALLMVTAAGAATADTGLAGDISIERTPFVSTLSRDAVRADAVANRNEVDAMRSEISSASSPRITSTLSRAAVVADYIAHRAEVAAMYAEDSGSHLLASTARPIPVIQLATH